MIGQVGYQFIAGFLSLISLAIRRRSSESSLPDRGDIEVVFCPTWHSKGASRNPYGNSETEGSAAK
jgi:hypothetical protein